MEGIQLNSISSDKLNCENKNGFKDCIVPESHFNKEGYYYTYYNNSLGNTSIAYEASTVKIILRQNNKPEDSNKNKLIGIIVGSAVGGLALIAIIIVFIVRYYKRKKNIINDFSEKSENRLFISNEWSCFW